MIFEPFYFDQSKTAITVQNYLENYWNRYIIYGLPYHAELSVLYINQRPNKL